MARALELAREAESREEVPVGAIVFGDAASEDWSVAQQVEDVRAYHVFEELNTFTAVVYLQKVNHPAGGTR
jgi:molybdopterin-containing oxidoreductase family iron-sulfur binding subunit